MKILSQNDKRRHLTKGQLALLAWKAYLTENKLSNLDDLQDRPELAVVN